MRSVTDAEVVTLAVAQAMMNIASDREFLADDPVANDRLFWLRVAAVAPGLAAFVAATFLAMGVSGTVLQVAWWVLTAATTLVLLGLLGVWRRTRLVA